MTTVIILIFALEIMILAMIVYEANKFERLYRSIASDQSKLDLSVYTIEKTLNSMQKQA